MDNCVTQEDIIRCSSADKHMNRPDNRSNTKSAESWPSTPTGNMPLGVLMIMNVSSECMGNMSTVSVRRLFAASMMTCQLMELELILTKVAFFIVTLTNPFTSQTIKGILDHWKSILLSQALIRLSLIVKQAAGSGLTSLIFTGQAMLLFPDFDWNVLHRAYANEWAGFVNAVNRFNGCMWYIVLIIETLAGLPRPITFPRSW